MLLDDRQIALNELIVAYREASDHFQDAIDNLNHNELTELFESIRVGHSEAVEALSEQIRKTGALPRAEYADRVQLHQLFTHVKAALSDDEREVFLTDRLEHERRIQNLLSDTLNLSIAADTRNCLRRLQTRENDVLSRLSAALDACVS